MKRGRPGWWEWEVTGVEPGSAPFAPLYIRRRVPKKRGDIPAHMQKYVTQNMGSAFSAGINDSERRDESEQDRKDSILAAFRNKPSWRDANARANTQRHEDALQQRCWIEQRCADVLAQKASTKSKIIDIQKQLQDAGRKVLADKTLYKILARLKTRNRSPAR